jgi:hypothetical protein
MIIISGLNGNYWRKIRLKPGIFPGISESSFKYEFVKLKIEGEKQIWVNNSEKGPRNCFLKYTIVREHMNNIPIKS